MLQIPNLDDITYEQLLQNAIHKIPQLTGEWTDFNLHDPGITTLEIYAWLTDMLNYYINASGDIHVKKYNIACNNKLNYLLIYPKWHKNWYSYLYNKNKEKYMESLNNSLCIILNKFKNKSNT